jgi:hypothetical protein
MYVYSFISEICDRWYIDLFELSELVKRNRRRFAIQLPAIQSRMQTTVTEHLQEICNNNPIPYAVQ